MQNNCVILVNIGRDYSADLSIPIVKKYCDKYNLNFEVIIEAKYNLNNSNYNYNYMIFEKNQIYDYFNKYDRILRLDSDILILPNCPNLFEVVPSNSLGAVFEDVGSRKKNRRSIIRNVVRELGNVTEWNEGYINSGVVVSSYIHKDIFNIDENSRKIIQNNNLSFCKEQTYLNWRIRKANINIYQLDYKFNHMTMFSESWKGADWKESYIIHYAGSMNKAKMKKDCNYVLNQWRNYN